MKYLAFDGTVFNNELDCRAYEKEHSSEEQKRVDELRDVLVKWLKNCNVEIGFHAVSDGEDADDVFLYSTNNEEIESKPLWDDED